MRSVLVQPGMVFYLVSEGLFIRQNDSLIFFADDGTIKAIEKGASREEGIETHVSRFSRNRRFRSRRGGATAGHMG